MFAASEKMLTTSSFKTKAAWQEIARLFLC